VSLILKRASASCPSGEWNDDDYDVLAGGAVVGRIMKASAAPVGAPWLWTLAQSANKLVANPAFPRASCSRGPPVSSKMGASQKLDRFS
jgi:hypothetical protein